MQDRNDDYEEVPVISNDDGEDTDDEVPPPPPPARTLSLQPSHINRPLPAIPMSESVHADLTTVNNKVNLEKNIQHGSNNIDRPLPPIPKDSSLEKVDEIGADDESSNIGDKRNRGSKELQNGTKDSDNDYDNISSVDEDDDNASEIDAVPDSESDIENDLTSRGFNPNNDLPPIPDSDKCDTLANGSINSDREQSTSSPENEL